MYETSSVPLHKGRSSMEKNLTALVTGGSRGIGRAVSVRLASTCAHTVIVNYLENDGEAEKARECVEAHQARCLLAKANLLHPDEIDQLFARIKSLTTSIDLFVHCAALGAFKPLLDIKPNQWDLTMNINARAFLLCVQKILPMMNEGSIVAISSLGSQRAIPNYGAMGPVKAALESLVRCLAVELAHRRIRVNAVTGGLITTDSITKFPDADRFIESTRQRTPTQRIGTPDDIADAVMFLASPASQWICGQTIVVDGGISIV